MMVSRTFVRRSVGVALIVVALIAQTMAGFFAQELIGAGLITHVRLRIFPDGGVSRLRVWGKLGG